MSTRCEVQVYQADDSLSAVQLYRHEDGDPESVFEDLASASASMKRDAVCRDPWKMGRAGYVASYICAANPSAFQPEQGLGMHGDEEFLYRLYVREGYPWEAEVFTQAHEKLHLLYRRQKFASLRRKVKQAAEKERQERERQEKARKDAEQQTPAFQQRFLRSRFPRLSPLSAGRN